MKFYLFTYSDEPVTDYVVCYVKESSPWFYLCWSLGKPFDEAFPTPIIYYADREEELQDYPLTNADQFLVSNTFHDVLVASGAKFASYESKIILPSGDILSHYFTLNFTESYFVLDRERSVFENDPDFPETHVYRIKKLILKSDLIPKDTQIFRLGESEINIIISEKLKQRIESKNLTGIEFNEIQAS